MTYSRQAWSPPKNLTAYLGPDTASLDIRLGSEYGQLSREDALALAGYIYEQFPVTVTEEVSD